MRGCEISSCCVREHGGSRRLVRQLARDAIAVLVVVAVVGNARLTVDVVVKTGTDATYSRQP